MALAATLQIASSNGQPMIEANQKTITVYFQIVASGNYVTGGDTLDLTQLFGATGGQPGMDVTTASLPLRVEIESAKAGGVSGWWYQYTPAAASPTLANGKMQIFGGSAAAGSVAQEMAAGAYPASVTGDVIIAKAILPKI